MRVTVTVDLPMTEAEYRDEYGVSPGSSGGFGSLLVAIEDNDAHDTIRVTFADDPADPAGRELTDAELRAAHKREFGVETPGEL